MDSFITTTFNIPGYHVTESFGIARGIVVRSRSIIGSFFAGIQTLFGGNISLFTELCESTREDACFLMMQHAKQLQANAVLGVRYDATDIMAGVTEVICYGTAVRIEPIKE